MVSRKFLNRISAILLVGTLSLLALAAYFYTAPVADVGDTYMAPAAIQAALRTFVIAQILRAFGLRWDEFTLGSVLGWSLVAAGITLNLARGLFGDQPLTLSFFLLHTGLVIVTWRLMAATRREKRLAAQLDESESIRRQQDEVIADLQADKERIGKQAKEFEIRARTAEELLARYTQQETHDHD